MPASLNLELFVRKGVVKDLFRHVIPGPALKLRRNLLRWWDLRRSIALLRQFGKASSGEDAFAMAAAFKGFGEYASLYSFQERSEICCFLNLIRDEEVKTACEIGSFYGGTLFMLTRVLPENAEVISIDWPEAQKEGSRRRKPFHEAFARAKQRVSVIYGNSRDIETQVELGAQLSAPLDLLFIDGDHSANGVRADFSNYVQYVRPGGMIAFHDIAPRQRLLHGVPDFWDQLRHSYRSVQFISENAEEPFGIGVIWWDGRLDRAVTLRLCS